MARNVVMATTMMAMAMVMVMDEDPDFEGW
jgi:hypothetical protein